VFGSLIAEIRQWYKDYTKGLSPLPTVALISVAVLIVIAEIYGNTSFYRKNLAFGDIHENAFLSLMPHIYWFFSSFVLYLIAPILILKIFGKSLKDFGLRLGDWQLGLKALLVFSVVMIAVVAVVLHTPTFARHYPLNKNALQGISFFLAYEFFYVLYFFAWEFVFRGFLLFSLKEVMGNYAILVQMVPFAILHIGKPAPEVFASIFAGLLLGVFALKTRSMIYCFLLHAISAVAMDLAVFLTTR